MKITSYATSLSCAALLAFAPLLTTACKKAVVAPEPEPPKENRNACFGLWEGRDKSGKTYTISFTDKEWECRVEEGGVSMPHYSGTYTHAGANLNLLIVKEGDLKTMDWRPQRGNLGPNLTGRLSGAGRALNITALTEADFMKKR